MRSAGCRDSVLFVPFQDVSAGAFGEGHLWPSPHAATGGGSGRSWSGPSGIAHRSEESQLIVVSGNIRRTCFSLLFGHLLHLLVPRHLRLANQPDLRKRLAHMPLRRRSDQLRPRRQSRAPLGENLVLAINQVRELIYHVHAHQVYQRGLVNVRRPQETDELVHQNFRGIHYRMLLRLNHLRCKVSQPR